MKLSSGWLEKQNQFLMDIFEQYDLLKFQEHKQISNLLVTHIQKQIIWKLCTATSRESR